jgi:hypothetical protein
MTQTSVRVHSAFSDPYLIVLAVLLVGYATLGTGSCSYWCGASMIYRAELAKNAALQGPLAAPLAAAGT